MTIEALRKRVEAIRAVSRDDEKAHGLEDNLYRDVLTAIADSDTCSDAPVLASIALETQLMPFDRWTA